jgi:D-alanyl-D-alanine carboxypeptidase (penicillin-binding protein 5/6)
MYRLAAISVVLVFVLACGGGGQAPTAPVATAAAVGEESFYPAAAAADFAAEPSPRFPAPAAWAPAPASRGITQPPQVSAASAVVVDEASGEVLYAKDAHLPRPPASLTKIATLILALEHGDLDAWVDVDVDSRLMRGSTVKGLIPGDRFRLRDLLYGLILPSGNDAALAIGRQVAGSDEAFVAQMNGLLDRFGLSEGHFSNPHGLGGVDHVISAYDLAMLARYGMSLPGFTEIVTTPVWTASGARVLTMSNINSFLYSYAGADGVKTGYTRRAGSTLAASATRNGHRLYVVLLDDPARVGDAIALLNWAYADFTWP